MSSTIRILWSTIMPCFDTSGITPGESRDQLRGYARRAEEQVHELAEKATEVVEQAVDKGREFLKDKQAVLTEAVETGRAAMQRERERLSTAKKA